MKQWKNLFCVMQKSNPVLEKSITLATKVVILTKKIEKNVSGYVLAKQFIRSGTSIGANVTEAQDASSKKDFIQKMMIALREAKETKYWLFLLKTGKLAPESDISKLEASAQEIIAILQRIVRTSKK